MTVQFESFESLLEQTKQIADEGSSPWCANSESSSSTGWIQTNWLEDILLTKYGPEVYDKWSRLEIRASNIKIYSSLKIIAHLFSILKIIANTVFIFKHNFF